jgi:putative oxidoreductase
MELENEKPSSVNRILFDISLLVVRVVVGVIMFVHGGQKLFSWFEGDGMEKMIAGNGPVLGYMVAVGECFGGMGLIVGFLSRFSAAANIVIMIGAIAMVHGKNGLLMQKGGFEYNLALIGLLVPILLCGPGRISIGRFLPLPKSKSSDRPVIVLE